MFEGTRMWFRVTKQKITQKKNAVKKRIGKVHDWLLRWLSPKYPVTRIYLFITVFVVLTVLQMPNLAVGAGFVYVCWLLENRVK